MNIDSFFYVGTCHKDDFVCPIHIGFMCLYASQKCDGRVLCPNEQDEQDCGEYPASNFNKVL